MALLPFGSPPPKTFTVLDARYLQRTNNLSDLANATTAISNLFGTEVANTVFAGPMTGADAVPTFRSLVVADIPTLTASKISDFDEAAQDAVGTILLDSGTIDFTYTDATPSITGIVIDDSITNTKLANMVQATIKGRASGAGTGDPTDLTAAQVATIINSSLDHGTLAGLLDDDHTQYALLAGRSGGQTLKGGTAAGDDLTLMSTNNATKGTIFFGTSGYDEVNNRLGIGTAVPTAPLEVVGNILVSATVGNAAITFSNANNVAVAPDILIAGNAVIAAETSLYILIDSNNDSTNATLIIGKDSDTSSATEIARFTESGQLNVSPTTTLLASSTSWGIVTDKDTNNYIIVGSHAGLEPGIVFYGTQGTSASPTATLDGDSIGSIYFQGWDTARSTGAAILARADGNWGGSATDSPGEILLQTAADATSTLTTKLYIGSTNKIGIFTTVPLHAFDILSAGNPSGFHLCTTTTDTGLYLTTTAASQAIISGGVMWDGSAWEARTTTASIMSLSSGTTVFSNDTGLTAGVTYTPTESMRITAANLVGIGNASPVQTLHVGAGADTPVFTASCLIYATKAGSTSIVVRDSTNNIEGAFFAGSSVVTVGSATAHDLEIRTGNTTGIYMDGSTQAVGIGIAAGTPLLVMEAGTSANSAAIGGILFVSTSQVGNVGTGQDVLNSYSVPANTLAVNGDSIWFEAHGTLAANLNVKTLRVRFGSSGTDTMLTVDISTGAASTWVVRGRVIRTGAATQKGWVIGASGNFPIEGSSQALNQTLSGAVTLQITGEATANNDMVIESFVVGWDSNNT